MSPIVIGIIGTIIFVGIIYTLSSSGSSEPPVDATCIGEIEDSFYTFSNTPIKGSEILKTLKEPFVLSSNIVIDPTKLVPSKSYSIGKRIVSNLKTPPLYGGANNCTEFPNTVYKPL